LVEERSALPRSLGIPDTLALGPLCARESVRPRSSPRALGKRDRCGTQFLAPRENGLQRAFQDYLERRKLLVAEVISFMTKATRFLTGIFHQPLCHLVRLAHDLGPLDHPLGLDAHLLQQVVGLTPARLHELITLTKEPSSLSHLVGEAIEGRLQQLEQLFARDENRG
jgi:hypothetical protein